VLACVACAVAALAGRRGNPDVALGVLGGGALIGLSYRAVKSGIDGLMRAAGIVAGPQSQGEGAEKPRISKGKLAILLFAFVGRYALLGLIAYVMIARLRLHPIGVMVGASSIVLAAAIEAVRPR